MRLLHTYPEIAGRDWQQLGLRIWGQKLATDEVDMFVSACPGAGKTRFSIAALKMALDTDAFDILVIVAPTDTLRRQWENDAEEQELFVSNRSCQVHVSNCEGLSSW